MRAMVLSEPNRPLSLLDIAIPEPGPDQRFCFHIPEFYSDAEAAPLLCAGLIGYRNSYERYPLISI